MNAVTGSTQGSGTGTTDREATVISVTIPFVQALMKAERKSACALDGICRVPMIPEWKLQMMANHIFRNYLSQKNKVLALANSMLEAHIDDKEDDVDYAAIIEKKCKEVERLRKKLDVFIEMRAEGEIDKESFGAKTAEVKEEIAKHSAEVEDLQLKLNKEPVITDYKDKLTVLQYALKQYNNADENDIPESVIEAFVVKIVAKRNGFDWYLRFDGDPNDPLHMKTEGKKRKNSKVLVIGGSSPNKQNCDTGSNR